MDPFFTRIMKFAEPVLWTALGGAAGAVADWVAAGNMPDPAHMKSVALTGAAVALAAYLRTPRHSDNAK